MVGAGFGKIVSSLVGDVIMPVLGKVIGGVSVADRSLSLGMGPDGVTPVVLKWGAFLQSVFDFVLIAAALFMAIKAINRIKAPPAAETPPAPAAPPAPPRNEVLLEEIRDLLKNPPR